VRRLVVGLAAAATLLPAGGAQALVDCTCYDISRVDTVHGPKLVLRNVRGWNLFDVSSDRRQVVYSYGGLGIAAVSGSQPRTLAGGYIYNAALSPDGRTIVFSEDSCGLCVVPAGGGSVTSLGLTNPSRWAAWAPDSQRLVLAEYQSPTSGLARLTVVNVDGSGRQALTPWRTNLSGGTSIGIKAAWSPDGERIAYIEGFPARLHVIRLRDGSDTAIARGRAPVWSPDGRRLAFIWNDRRLAVIGADGSHVQTVDSLAIDHYAFGAAWSPAGRQLAYRRSSVGDDLWIARPDGSRRRRLTRGVRDEEIGPIYWSRDGETILFTHFVQFGE
jgi:Tol biopolymer transport system component